MPSWENPRIPEGINVTREHPLKELFLLGGALLAIGLAALLILNMTAGWIAHAIPFSFEQEMAAGITERFPPGDPTMEPYLQELAERLAETMALPEEMTITVHLLEGETINAFATLGGHIFVHEGLVRLLPDENSLAMVLAHEVAHVKARDPMVALGRGLLVGAALAVVTGTSGNDAADWLLGNASLITTLAYNRAQEEAADRQALTTLALHYGHVGGATELFLLLGEDGTDGLATGTPELFSTHPAPDDRIERIRRIAREAGWPLEGPRRPLPTH